MILVPAAKAEQVPRAFTTYGKILNFYNKIGFFPLRWNQQAGQICVAQFRPWSVLMKGVLALSHMIFLASRAAHIWSTDAPRTEKLYLSLQASVYSAVSVNLAIMLYHPPLLASLLNNVLKMQRKYDPRGLLDKGKGPRIVLYSALFLINFAPITFVLRLLKYPADPRNVTSLLPDLSYTGRIIRLLVLLYQFYAITLKSATLWFTVGTMAVFLRTLIGIIRTIRSKSKDRRNEDLGGLVKATTELSILVTWFNNVFGRWTLVWETTFILVLVIDITIAVLNQSVRALLVALSIVTMMMYLYSRMAEIYEESTDILSSRLLQSNNEPWFKRRCRAYRTLRINVGSFFYADRALVLTMLSIVTENTANTILTVKGK